LTFGVSISQKDDVLLYWLEERFGGGVSRSKQYIPKWIVATSGAVAFLEAIRPYLVIRGKDVDEVLQIYENRLMKDRPALERLLKERKDRLRRKKGS